MEVVTADKGLAGSALAPREGGAGHPWHLPRHHSWIQLFSVSPKAQNMQSFLILLWAKVELAREAGGNRKQGSEPAVS